MCVNAYQIGNYLFSSFLSVGFCSPYASKITHNTGHSFEFLNCFLKHEKGATKEHTSASSLPLDMVYVLDDNRE